MSQSPQCKVAISKVINQELFEEKVILISKAILDPAKENYFMLVDNTTEQEVLVIENEWLATIEAMRMQ